MTTEVDLIQATDRPATPATLTADLLALGVSSGGVVIVHSSMSAIGWVAGGAQGIVESLFDAVGPAGTIVMPTQSGQLSDPANWSNPPVPADWLDVLRRELPAYEPYLTPTRAMGQIVECFRQHRETLRSNHPLLSFAANGPAAAYIVDDHQLTPGLDDSSPLGRLYEVEAQILLLGVGHANNTSLHLAEYRATWPGKTTCREGAPILRDGCRTWATYEDLDRYEGDFQAIGDAFAKTGRERTGPIGAATGRLCWQPEMVDFATAWMTSNRGTSSRS